MTNYNDGRWYGWNGGNGPLHPKTLVDVRYSDTKCVVPVEEAGDPRTVRWTYKWGGAVIVAFRVVKEYREPREFWIINGCSVCETEEHAKRASYSDDEVIHVREVLE